jgi:hypothetical protein
MQPEATPPIVQVEFTRATGLLLNKIFAAKDAPPRPSFAWPSGAGAVPDVGETVIYAGMDEHPMRVVSRHWEVVPGEFRLILQLGIEG